ncbi:hypothetical protein B0H16DRAFT_1466032 [Mycena metata]|uniref:Uncharacterized protein n=1 Tax=Mycena metata TaxID=1033252 RepID=A0AAD7IB11_9AGAR|nr:hypothetical protein B0H16DRAFT_1466032 [Mycena metata]
MCRQEVKIRGVKLGLWRPAAGSSHTATSELHTKRKSSVYSVSLSARAISSAASSFLQLQCEDVIGFKVKKAHCEELDKRFAVLRLKRGQGDLERGFAHTMQEFWIHGTSAQDSITPWPVLDRTDSLETTTDEPTLRDGDHPRFEQARSLRGTKRRIIRGTDSPEHFWIVFCGAGYAELGGKRRNGVFCRGRPNKSANGPQNWAKTCHKTQ